MNNLLKHITICICISVFSVCSIIGLFYKSSYTDITKNPDFMNQMKVCVLSEDVAMDLTDVLTENSTIILKVKAYGEPIYEFKTIREKVNVQYVFKGDEKLENQDIYLWKNGWVIFEDHTRNMGFTNCLQKNHTYLVFITEKVKNLRNERLDTYQLVDTIISPVFDYEKRDNTIISWSNTEEGYIDYTQIQNNEFFVSSQAALNIVSEMKRKLFSEYQ